MERKSYENKSIVADGGRGLPWKQHYSRGTGEALGRGAWAKLEFITISGDWWTWREGGGRVPHPVETLLTHCGGKRYKRAPREKECSGKRLSRQSCSFPHRCTSLTVCLRKSVYVCVCVCVWEKEYECLTEVCGPHHSRIKLAQVSFSTGREYWLDGGGDEELLKPGCRWTCEHCLIFRGGGFLFWFGCFALSLWVEVKRWLWKCLQRNLSRSRDLIPPSCHWSAGSLVFLFSFDRSLDAEAEWTPPLCWTQITMTLTWTSGFTSRTASMRLASPWPFSTRWCASWD